MPNLPSYAVRRPAAYAFFVLAMSAVAALPAVADPLLSVSNVELGEVSRGIVRSAELRLCNSGTGTLTFAGAAEIVTGIGDGFSVTKKELDRLRAARLGPGQCFRLPVTFVSQVPERPPHRSSRKGSAVRSR